MKTKNGLIMTLVMSVLLILSTFGGMVLTVGAIEVSLEVVKEVWDGQDWVDEIDVYPGDTVQFRITITYYNITDPQHIHWAKNIIVSDTLPDCFEYETGSAQPFEPSISGNLLTWDLGGTILYHEESYVITFNASIPGEGCTGGKINEAEAKADEHCTGKNLFGEDTATVNVLVNAEIDVEKYVSLDGCDWFEEVYAYYCTDVIFKIVVENTGDVNLIDVYVNDTLSDSLEYNNSATPEEPMILPDGTLVWYFQVVEVDEIIEIQFNAHVIGDPCDEDINWVEVRGETECGQVVEDEDSVTVYVNGMCVEKKVWNGQEWAEETIAGVGEIVRFKITICYYGDYILYGIKVRDELPDCLEYVPGSADPEEPEISEDGRTLWWNLSQVLQDGQCLSIEFDALVACDECEILENLANVTAMECSGATFGEDTAIVHIECTLTADAGGPYSGQVDEDIEIEGSATGGTPSYDYYWDLDNDGEYDDATGKIITHSWSKPDTYTIWLKVIDDDDDEATDYARVDITLENEPPDKPGISGPTRGIAGVEYDYVFEADDPDGHDVYYWIDWDDGDIEEWIGPYTSGDPQTVSHTWSALGTYTVNAKAKDEYGAESGVATLHVIMPRNRAVNSPFLQFIEGLLEKFPNAFPILRLLLQRLGL